MNDGLKQRIVGALVLIALGIIFIPVIFDKERIVPVDRTSQIPPEPDIVAIPLPEPAVAPRPKAKELQGPINGEFKIEETPETALSEKSAKNEEAGKSEPVAIKETNKPEPIEVGAWVLQVASYKDKTRADALRKNLIDQGYQSFIKTVQLSAGERTRLYIGPTISKASLEKAKKKIDRKYGVDAKILKFAP